MAKQTVRMNLNISPEAAEQLEALTKILSTTKTSVVEQAIRRLYDEEIKEASK